MFEPIQAYHHQGSVDNSANNNNPHHTPHHTPGGELGREDSLPESRTTGDEYEDDAGWSSDDYEDHVGVDPLSYLSHEQVSARYSTDLGGCAVSCTVPTGPGNS